METLKTVKQFIRELEKKRIARPFLKPVDVLRLGLSDYNDIIARPFDLASLKSQIEKVCVVFALD